jgi:hypothetical protein
MTSEARKNYDFAINTLRNEDGPYPVRETVAAAIEALRALLTEPKLAQEIPPMVAIEESAADKSAFQINSYRVLSWRGPGDDANTEVHLELPLPGTPASLFLCLKSARALDELVDVWP